MTTFLSRAQRPSAVRTVLVVAVVLLVVLGGLTLVMGMGGMGSCDECGPVTLPCGSSCLVTLPGAVGALAAAAAGVVWLGVRRRAAFVYAWSLDPPPRSA